MGDQIWPRHLKLSFGGTLGNPAMETWSNTLRFHFGGTWTGVPIIGADPYEPTPEELGSMADLLVGAVHDWLQNASSFIGAAASASWLKLVVITEDGTQRDSNTVVRDFAPVPGVTNNSIPWYVTTVVTLRTILQRGRGHAGRIYPPLAHPVNYNPLTPYIQEANAISMATAASEFIKSCETRMTSVIPDVGDPLWQNCHAVVVSPGSHQKGTGALAYDIVSTEVDRVADVMHSRTRSVPRLAPAAVVLHP